MNAKIVTVFSGIALLLSAPAAMADWKPAKSIEFIVTSGPGGGTDTFARSVQNIITKYNMIDQPIVVVNKGGGSGAEGYVYVKSKSGNPYEIIFGTSNTWQQPMVSKVAFKYTDMTPIATMVMDEFLLWVKQDSPHQNAKDWLRGAASGDLRMGGGQSKDTDEVLTRIIAKEAKLKLTYIPFRSGGEAAVQLAGGHIDSHVNNPSESVGHWKGSTQRPLCVFRSTRLPEGPKITATQAWHDIPTCVESGLNIPDYQQPRTVWMAGGVTADQSAFYVDLMRRVQATPDWKEFIERTSQTDVFLAGDAFQKFIKEDIERLKVIGAEEGWLVAN